MGTMIDVVNGIYNLLTKDTKSLSCMVIWELECVASVNSVSFLHCFCSVKDLQQREQENTSSCWHEHEKSLIEDRQRPMDIARLRKKHPTAPGTPTTLSIRFTRGKKYLVWSSYITIIYGNNHTSPWPAFPAASQPGQIKSPQAGSDHL